MLGEGRNETSRVRVHTHHFLLITIVVVERFVYNRTGNVHFFVEFEATNTN